MSIRPRVYPRLAAMLLLSSALLGVVVVGAFIAVGSSAVLALISICVDLIFNVAVGWLGYSLWREEEYKLDDNGTLGSEDQGIRSYSG